MVTYFLNRMSPPKALGSKTTGIYLNSGDIMHISVLTLIIRYIEEVHCQCCQNLAVLLLEYILKSWPTEISFFWRYHGLVDYRN